MPLHIHETRIQAKASDQNAESKKNEKDQEIGFISKTTELEGRIQKVLIRKLKIRDER